jgi:hypothetical protein
MAGIFEDLLGTVANVFQFGLGGPKAKPMTSSKLALRNAADSDDAELMASKVSLSGADMAVTANGHTLTLSGNSALGGDLQIIFPQGKGSDGQSLVQKAGTAAGVIEFEWASAGNTAPLDHVDTTTVGFGSTSPVALFNTGAATVLEYFEVIVDTAFDGTPSLSIGVEGSVSKYVPSTKVNLTAAAGTKFRIPVSLPAQGAESLIATFAAGGATVGSARLLAHYSDPA